MQNDSKLGMLAGVAGVVVAAVLYTQPQAAPPPVENAKSAPPAATTPVAPAPPSTPVAVRGRPEVEGKTASRPRADEDD